MIEPRYRKHMTLEMLEYIEHMNSLVEKEIQLCNREMNKCAVLMNIDATTRSTSGLPIVNGSISQIRELQRYWFNRLKMIQALQST